MTEKEIVELTRRWQTRLGLDHWRIEIRVETIPDDGNPCFAICERPANYNRAVIRFQPWLLTDDRAPASLTQRTIDDRVRETTAVHELLHCVTRDYRAVLEDHIDGQVHRDVFTLLDEVCGAVEERTIEALATALVEAFGETPPSVVV